jgi:predicted lipoprotein with Yx(FWY)xxD motif
MKTLGAVLLLLVGPAFVGHVATVEAQFGQSNNRLVQSPPGVQVQKSAAGTMVLADAKGLTLYTFAKDMAGMSHCAGPCAKNWPPLAAAADAKPIGDWTIVAREDGTKQWAYKGMPLYTWIKDAKPGDATGEGMAMGAWRVAVP